MILNKKVSTPPNHWLTMIIMGAMTCLNGCDCMKDGGGIETIAIPQSYDKPDSLEEDENTFKSIRKQSLKAADEQGDEIFQLLKDLPPKSAKQKEAEKKAINQIIENLSDKEKIIFSLHLASSDMESEPFVDLFVNATNGKYCFERYLIPAIKLEALEIQRKGHSFNDVSNLVNHKKNNSLYQGEYDSLMFFKEIIQKAYINPLKKVAEEQAKN